MRNFTAHLPDVRDRPKSTSLTYFFKQAIETGLNFHLCKPYEFAKLQALIAAHRTTSAARRLLDTPSQESQEWIHYACPDLTMNRYSVLVRITAVFVSWLSLCAPAVSQTAGGDQQDRVVGLAFVGRSVADLDRSVAFYKAIGFREDSGTDPAWHKDKVIAHLYGVDRIETRTARMFVTNAASGQPFVVYLRELKGNKRRNLAGHPAWEPGATHFSLVVPDAQLLWSQLQAAGLLRARTWGAQLIAPPGQTKGSIAYLTDPDGLDIELLNQRPAAPIEAGHIANPDTLSGVGHAGLVVLDSARSRAFYGQVLGGHLQNADSPWLKGDFYDSVVGGHGNIVRIYDESFPEAAAPQFHLNFALIEFQNRKQPVEAYDITDIGVGYVGFQVQGLDALLAQAKAAGARVVSKPEIAVEKDGTREVLMRDPDVGGFVELFEKPKH
jgi:catechol 2,3-dioxygenase-like lactoylglutathione lyase family enzyme